MELINYMKTILDGQPLKYSILFGEEQKIIDIYIDKLSELGYTKVYKESVADAIKETNKGGFIKTKKIIIVSNDDEFIKHETKWELLKELKSKNIIVLRYFNLKKTTKFYKFFKDNCVEFNYVNDEVFQNYILKMVPKLSDKNVYRLQDICKNNYGRLLLEVDKIKNLSKKLECSSNTAFNQLLEDDLFVSEIGDITFKLTDAITYGDLKNTQKYLMQAKIKGEPVLRVISIIYNNFINLLAYQGLGKNKIDAADRIGVSEKQLWVIKKNSGGYNNKELLRNINICQQVESDIKLGRLSENIALDYLVLNCLW